MRSILKRSYPFPESMASKLIHASIGGIVITTILYFLRPFDIDNIKALQELFIVGFGIITFLIVYLSYATLPLLFPGFFSEKNWNIGRQIVLVTSVILMISISNWLYSYIWIGDEYEFPSLPRFIFITSVLSFPPSVSGVLFNDLVRRKYKTEK